MVWRRLRVSETAPKLFKKATLERAYCDETAVLAAITSIEWGGPSNEPISAVQQHRLSPIRIMHCHHRDAAVDHCRVDVLSQTCVLAHVECRQNTDRREQAAPRKICEKIQREGWDTANRAERSEGARKARVI